jgi:hypothetical protein
VLQWHPESKEHFLAVGLGKQKQSQLAHSARRRRFGGVTTGAQGWPVCLTLGKGQASFKMKHVNLMMD